MTSALWPSVIGAGGVVVGAALSQVVTRLNAKEARKDHQADLDRARRERMNDLEREVGVRLLVALDHALAVKLAHDVVSDTEIIRASCEELEIVGTAEVALAARFVAVYLQSVLDKLAEPGKLDTATWDRLGNSARELSRALRERHWHPEGAGGSAPKAAPPPGQGGPT